MRTVLAGLLLSLVMALPASAQTGKLLAVGGGITEHKQIDSDFTPVKNPGISVDYRISFKRSPTQGWKWEPKGGFSWASSDVDKPVLGVSSRIGHIRTRPIMVGVERAYRQGPFKVGVSGVVGPSFNHFTRDGAAPAALTGGHVKTSIAVRPELSGWYDFNKWFALHVAFNYVINRVTADTTVGGNTTSEKWNTDRFNAHIGLVVGIF